MTVPREQLLDLSDLARDERLRFRDLMHEASGTAQKYAEAMLEYGGWGEFPPATVVELTEPFEWSEEVPHPRFPREGKVVRRTYPAGTLVLVGGFTRTAAMASAKESEDAPASFDPRVPCRIVSGTWGDALRLAWLENSRHGRARSSDETAAVLRSIHANPDHATAGEREVAKLAGVSRATVNRFRAKLAAEARACEPKPAPKVNPVADTPFEPPVAAYQPDAEPPPPPAPSPPASAPLLRDEWGRPVPECVAPLWEALPVIKRAARDIRAACLALGAAKHGPDGAAECLTPGLALVDVRAVVAAGYTAADLLDSQAPFLVCPQCDGHGDFRGKSCKLCGSQGALTRPQADALSPQLETKAKSFRGNP